MAVDFRDLHYKLESLDVWSIKDNKQDAFNLVESMDGDELRALSLMAAKRHTVKKIPDGTKTFELLENVIVGLHSEDCVDLAKQTISIAPDWVLRTLLLASINRFNTVDQLEIRRLITERGHDVELSADELAAAQQAAAEAAARAAAIERGEIPADGEEDASDGKKGRSRKDRAPRGKKTAKSPAGDSAGDKPKRNWLTGK
jgi:hypothetical protein